MLRHFFIVVDVFIVRAKFGCLIVKSTKNSRVAGARTTGEKRHEKQQCKRKKNQRHFLGVQATRRGRAFLHDIIYVSLSFCSDDMYQQLCQSIEIWLFSLYLNTVQLKLLDGTTFIFTYTKSSNSWGQARRLGGAGIRWIDSCNFRASVNWKKNISETKKKLCLVRKWVFLFHIHALLL